MAVLKAAGVVLAGVLVGGLLAAVTYRLDRVDPLRSFAATMVAASVAIVAYYLVAGFGYLPAVLALGTLLSSLLAFAVLGSLAVVRLMDRRDSRWGDALRSRLVMGVPWGTLVTAVFVLLTYLYLQNGWESPYSPVVMPFRAWSYSYPLGILTSGFTHNGLGHLLGNLVGTLIFGTIAEYAWGHFPSKRGDSSFGGLLTNPWVRAFVVFPGAMVVAGLLMSAFSMGPVIGFSGVVFAMAGFAVVRYPVASVAATVAEGVLWETYLAITNPILTVSPSPSPPSAPGWASIAIQVHALGILLGIAAGAYVFHRRNDTPSALRLWTGVLLLAMVKNLWAIYWFRGNGDYVLFRGPGLVIVGVLAVVVAAAVVASDRSIVRFRPRATPGRFSTDGGTGGADSDGDGISTRQIAMLALVLLIGVVGGLGAGSNFFTIADKEAPDDAVQVRDYEVYYAEDVTNQRVAIVNVSAFNETTQVRTSGVIVRSQDRSLWQTAVSKNRLAFTGYARVRLGGVGWDEDVYVARDGWKAAGGPSAYKIWLRPEGGDRRLAYVSEPATAAPTIRHRNVSLIPTPQGFALVVSRNDSTVGTASIPTGKQSVEAGGLTFVRRGNDVYAVANGTRVEVASKETYD